MKKIKSLLSLLLCVFMMLTAVQGVYAVETPAGGKIGDNISYELSDEGTLKIKGTGKMNNWEWNGSPFFDNRKITKVIVEKGVESIGSGAFSWCGSIKEVILPEGLKHIGNYAFYDCGSLLDITLPMTVEDIGSFAWGYCENIRNICIPDSTVNIRNGAFKGDTGIKDIYIGTGLKTVGNEAFAGCSGIKNIYVKDAGLFASVEFGEKQGQ